MGKRSWANRKHAGKIPQLPPKFMRARGDHTQLSVGQATIEMSVILKFVFFLVALAVLPIATYFYCFKYYFPGNEVYSALAAAAVVNVVVVAFVAVAILEDDDEKIDTRRDRPRKAANDAHIAMDKNKVE